MFWKFPPELDDKGNVVEPLKIPTLNTQTEERGYKSFDSKEEFVAFVWSQFKLPGEYNLKNTIRWQDVGMQYTKTCTLPNFEGGSYSPAIKGTYRYKQFWRVEREKALNGIIIDGIYVPPFYYWYLNFCPIYDALKNKKRLGDVWDSDLWFFHYVMLCFLLGKHVCVVKARQRGYSFKIMALLYWCYSWKEGSINTIGAYKDESTLKSWRFLEFYRQHLNKNTWWKRGPVYPKTQEWIERTYLVDGTYSGLDSKISATTLKVDPENGVGGSQTIFFYEEAGIAPKLLHTIGYVRPALERGNRTTGLIVISGSVGDLDDCKDLKEVFYSPNAHNFLAVKNIWDKKTEHAGKPCGLFVSEAYNLEGYIDKDGNSLIEPAMEFIRENNIRAKTLKRSELAQLDISQKPTSPEEAFAQRKKSEFPVEELLRQQERIKLKDSENRWNPRPLKCTLFSNDKGEVQFNTLNLPEEHGYPIHPDWDDKRGITTIFELPKKNAKWQTYFAGVDTVEVDETTTSESVMTVDIYQRMVKFRYKDIDGKVKIRIEGGRIVANYRGRYNPVEKGNEQAWLLIKLYNAFTYVERSKPNFINYMKRNGRAEKYLAKESDVPIFRHLTENSALSKSSYGFIITPTNQMWNILKNNVKEYFNTEFGRVEKPDGEVVKIYTGIDMTDDYWLCEEYINYNDKDNFDRIVSHSAAITIGKVYENEYGIPTINEVAEEDKVIIRQPKRQIDMLGGGMRVNTIGGKPKKPFSML